MSRSRRLTRAGVPNKNSAEIKTQTYKFFVKKMFCRNWKNIIVFTPYFSPGILEVNQEVKRYHDRNLTKATHGIFPNCVFLLSVDVSS